MSFKAIFMISLLVIQITCIATALWLNFADPKARNFDEYYRKVERRYEISLIFIAIAWAAGPVAILFYGFTTFVISG